MAWNQIADLTGPPGQDGSDADVTAHEAASDPHPGYATDAELSSGLAGKANASHSHAQSDITGLATSLAGKADSSHSHATADVTGLDTALSGKQATSEKGQANGYASLDGSGDVPIGQLPTGTSGTTVALGNDARFTDARTPTAHSHAQSDVTGLSTALGAKQDTSAKGQASGYASLDSGTKVPIAQLPTGTSSTTVAIGNDARLSDARTPTAHTHAQADVTGLSTALSGKQDTSAKGAASGYASLDAATKLPVAQMPVVLSAIRSGSFASSYTPDAAGAGNIIDVTATGNLTINAPTNPVNGQLLRLAVLASGALRTVTFSGVAVSTGLTVGPYSVPQDQVLLAVLTYSTLRTTPAWVLTACTVSA